MTSGAAAISSPSATSVLVTQSSKNAIINWGSFSIGAGNAVRFENGGGATLNRVTGLSRSQIDGTLTATGSVYLVNPNGITVGPTGAVTTGGSFVASTHDVSDTAFMAGGDMTFRGTSSASVINYGSIGSLGGDVALIARTVENAGTITAPNGTAALAAGYEVLMRDSALSDGKFLVKVGGADTQAKTTGVIKAAEVELRANGGNVYALAGNTSSITKATGVASKGGRIFFTAGDGGTVNVSQKVVARGASTNGKAKGGEIRVSGGTVKVSGHLDARGKRDSGGTIVVTGRDIALATGANLDASGTVGGRVLVGGDYQGGHDAASKYLPEAIPTAQTTTVATGARIAANGTTGAGGKVVVWSDQLTSFQGAISATGASVGGDAEVSGKAVLDYRGTVDLRGAGGFGTLLLDPYNLTISNAADAGMSGFSANANDSVLNVTTLQNALANANVTVTTGSGGSQAGNITVAAPVTWTSGSALTLSAYGNIAVNANLAGGTGSTIALLADNTGTGTGTVTFGSGITATATGGVSITYNPTGNNSTSVNSTSYTTPTNYSSNAGSGTTITAYMLVNTPYDLQNLLNNLSGTYALGRDIDASATAGWNSGAGFVPIGNNSNKFNGTFDGQGHSISGLTINRSGTDKVGLFGSTNNGSVIRNVGLVGGSVLGGYSIGELVGINYGTITRAYATGSVTGFRGSADVGGLVGDNFGNISQSYATGNVTGLGSNSSVGGLVGYNAVSISQSYSTGRVAGSAVGWSGLVGGSGGTITASFYDQSTIGQTSGLTTISGVTGKTDAEMQNPFTFINAGWDFASVWGKSTTGANGGYMMLRAVSTGALYTDYFQLSGNTSKTYGDANPSTSGITVSGIGASNATLAWGSAATPQTNAGTYNYATANLLTVTDGSGNSAYVDYGTGTLTVNTRSITVTADAQTQVYGSAVPTLTYTVGGSGLVNGDTLTGALASTASSTANVGSYGITQGTLAASANYALTYTGSNVSVTARPITVTANNQSRTSGSANPTLTWVLSNGNLVNGDSLTGVLGTPAGATSPAGSYPILQNTLAASGNYLLTYVGGVLTVTPAPGDGNAGGGWASHPPAQVVQTVTASVLPTLLISQAPTDQKVLTSQTVLPVQESTSDNSNSNSKT
ncbi:S-layer family protein, partial [Rhodopseudomonas sp. B29]|uniref:beta strand repeat-containing protein n=1 Tax=Rhodopseudomonas sp. B29 TaxID=95607 RepID=UPI001AEC1104